jgi:tetratricopeptide (TPR) repeat protein
MLRGLAVVLLSSGIDVHAQDSDVGREMPDWWKAQGDVVAVLLEQRTDLAELVEEVTSSKPKTGQEAMVKLSVFMRAGMTQEALETVDELKGLCPDLDNHGVEMIYHAACEEFSAWEVAQAVVEAFADNISKMRLEDRLLEHFQRSGWSVDDVDRWLANMPPGRDGFWIKQRLRFNTIHGRGEKLVRELTNHVRKNPQDVDGAVTFLDALSYARQTAAQERDLSWMTEIIHPQLATEAERIASRLKTLNDWMTAAAFYRQAINKPLTDEEVRQLGIMFAVFVSPEKLRAGFAARGREAMAECFLEMGQSDEAQKWMVEAADIREKHDLDVNAMFAGQVQGASGQRVIEGRIKEKETKSESDPEYWWERAEYYRGRNEPEQREHALRAGLALTTPQAPPQRPSSWSRDWRSRLLLDYARFLARMDRTAEAVALLRKDIEQAPATSESARRAVSMLAFDFERQLSADDEVLWTWLANRPKWGPTAEHLLWRMLENADRDDLDRYFVRAEELANGKDPTRARTLGWIMNRMHFPKRSIPLLKYAIHSTDDKQLKERAQFTLFESYLDTRDWMRAEQVFPEASKRLTPGEVPDWYSRIAMIAARAGAKADAMRIWKGVANVNATELSSLDNLVKFGLKDELVVFYGEMAKKMPSSEVPARAMKMLEDSGLDTPQQ